ncbi:putative Zn-dependent protease [Elusimicrobium posterum]|uniref:M48 family metallopeptidase n=1 Tax=Elusimicrobium posterum TaxID=3116653 RepID=UPI003C7500EA
MKKNLLLLIFICFLFSCATVQGTGRKQFMTISPSEEVSMGAQSFNQILSQSKVITNTMQANMVKRVGQNLAKHVNVNYQWEFVLIEDKQVNAFCLPGGKVAVYTGILAVTQDEDGLAVVMGHEIGHALARHGAERMSQNSLISLGGQILGMTQKTSTFTNAYGVATQLGIALPFSRSHESEADYLGLILMAKAGYDPRKAVGFWQRMNAAGSGKGLEFLSTHPSDSRRISDIQKIYPKP